MMELLVRGGLLTLLRENWCCDAGFWFEVGGRGLALRQGLC